MTDFITDLITSVEQGTAALRRISDEESACRPAPGKWSPKEILGHLVDSATNNHQRFVRAQLQEDLVFSGYDQDAWVALQRYQERPWMDLIELWRAYNLHIAHVMSAAPEEVLRKPRPRHNLDQLAWGQVPEGEAPMLESLMRDYVGHLKHHLAQILSVPSVSGTNRRS
jgi:hypothetical protein